MNIRRSKNPHYPFEVVIGAMVRSFEDYYEAVDYVRKQEDL